MLSSTSWDFGAVSLPLQWSLEPFFPLSDFALEALVGVSMEICRCCMMHSMFLSMDLRQSRSCSGRALDTRLLGEVPFHRLLPWGAFLSCASSLSISALVGLLSNSMAYTEMLASLTFDA